MQIIYKYNCSVLLKFWYVSVKIIKIIFFILEDWVLVYWNWQKIAIISTHTILNLNIFVWSAEVILVQKFDQNSPLVRKCFISFAFRYNLII